MTSPWTPPTATSTLRPRQDGRRFPDDTFERIFLKENVIILIRISLKFVPDGPINNIPALVRIMAWRRPGDKPLSEPVMVSLLTHICVTRPQWVKLSPCNRLPEASCDYRHPADGWCDVAVPSVMPVWHLNQEQEDLLQVGLDKNVGCSRHLTERSLNKMV